jgi:RHS repeat-associated protein
MVKNVTLLSGFACLLLALFYPAKQQRGDRMITYANSIKAKADSMRLLAIPESADKDNNAAPASTPADIIAIPEPPQSAGYTPNSLKDFKTADPGEGMSFINAPVANSIGNAVLNFTMKLPEGRANLQPAFNVQYNNEGGSTWLGYGWDMFLPAVTIDTRWGAPRYDASLETEMYNLNGEQLAPVNNRSALIARSSEKQFYPRVEGSFNKVVRRGSNPNNYWWEVTDKTGTVYSYGGKGDTVVNTAVLRDAHNNIAYWALVETRDPNDNYVHYVYETVADPGIAGGTEPGKQLYLSQVFYTGWGETEGAYKVEFIRDRQLQEPKRKDVIIDARLGFKMVSADLLRKVKISFNNTLIRSYEYKYREGAFYKTLLDSISELDDAGVVFYKHGFDYYDDVNKQGAFRPGTDAVPWQVGNDNIEGTLDNPAVDFSGEASVLSTAQADSRGMGLAVTIGTIFGGTWSKKSSVGGSFGYEEDNELVLAYMVDINGDGLPDKVFVKQGIGIFYRRNLGGATRSFGEPRTITGIQQIGTTDSKSFSGGAQAIPYVGFFGYNHTSTKATTKVYFSDFNGDGLMDMAYAGKVLFNHLNANGDPDFVANSGLTPSPIFTGSIDKSFLAIDTALQSKQERDFPLQDIVRCWVAPFSGIITVDAPVQLVQLPQSGIANTKKDGVRASIQQGDIVLWNTVIDANDYAVKTPALGNLSVTKGQRLYFRLQSRYNGSDDFVNWDPVIDYVGTVPVSSDIHYKTSSHYQASADFILHSASTVGMGKDGAIAIDGSFAKQLTSDSVIVRITQMRHDTLINLFEKPYAGTELADGPLAVPGQWLVKADDELHFYLVSHSYIDRSALQWKPHYAYTAFDDNAQVTDGNGIPILHAYVVPDNSNYNNWIFTAPPVTVAQEDSVLLWPQVSASGGASGTLWFTVKGTDTIYARRQIEVAGGAMSTAMDTIRLVRKPNEKWFLEFAADDPGFAAQLLPPTAIAYKDSIFINAGLPDTLAINDTLQANLYANPAEYYLGSLFRGWGQFALKGDKGDITIDQSILNLAELSGYPSDPNSYQDSASLASLPSPSSTNFIMLYPNAVKQSWVGYDSSVFVTANTMSSARLWMQDVAVDSLMAGESAGAVYRISSTEIESFSGGVIIRGGATAGTSTATTTMELDMMDMNGDRYPDVVKGDQIQYTLPNGGLGTVTLSHPVGTTTSDGSSWGISLGGEFESASTEVSTKQGAAAAPETAEHSAGLSGSINTNEDESASSWIDINGDGLTDRIYKDGHVSLNLGYSFAAPEQWGVAGIERGKSTSLGAGGGFNLDASSFSGGIGLSRTTAKNTIMLYDVNGDGLPDEISNESGTELVRLNTGTGFGPTIAWQPVRLTGVVSTGESLNGAITIPITIPIIFLKICINPSFNAGRGVSKQEDQIMDIDGDGYADMLRSATDGELTATTSTIGRTNMLRKVQRPLGASFTMDYERMGNTYDMPQSKWVLKSVDIFDGVTGDGVDTMRRRFRYEDGYQDRHEREFYGFKKVITQELNTAANNIVYRSRVQQFLNTTYYNKGLLASEWLEDATGKKFTQTNNVYEPRVILTGMVEFPALKQTEKLFYEGAATPGLTTAIEYRYDALGNITKISDRGDGSQEDMTVTDITYQDVPGLYIKSVPASTTVTTVDGVKRKRTTTIDNTSGDITGIKQFLADGTAAETNITYDDYGNVTSIIRPANYKGKRMWYGYEYDDVVHSYVTKTTDTFGYTSTNAWDYRFGALTGTVSINNEPTKYTLDNRGRLLSFTGPLELAANKPYTVAFDYYPEAPVPFGLTRHYDPEYSMDIPLFNFVDGFDRPIQVKKQIALFKGKGVADEVKMTVSGKVWYDAFGRAVQTDYPVTEAIDFSMLTLNRTQGKQASSMQYDVQDRSLKTILADGSTTDIGYTIANGMFSKMVTDALGNRRETLTDVQNRQRFLKVAGPDGNITTRYDYNALSELVKVVDNKGSITAFTYDNLGRKLSVQHPDAGLTAFEYDPAGNVLKKVDARIRKQTPNGAIQYQYEFERMTDIDYPYNYQNKVSYTYGKAGTGSKAGRVLLQKDASGGQEFFYGLQGAITKVIRTVLISPVLATTYVSEQEFDTWHRLKKMIYPDGEQVSYHYNKGGGVRSMEGTKLGSTYKYVEQLGYNEFEERVYLLYGNGTATRYNYDSLRRRLTQLQVMTPTGRALMDNSYRYDAVSNVLGIVNNAQARNDKLGGYAKQDYHYDILYRLDSASGEYKGPKGNTGYGIKVDYDNEYNIVHKKMRAGTDNGYDQSYVYGATAPHQATQIGANNYTYDPNGNQLGYGDLENDWDEESRLVAVYNKGVVSQYTYDADGNRMVKSSKGEQSVWLNGMPAGTVRHNDNYTVYVNPYLVCNSSGFTKNYYIEDQRVAAKLGHGNFVNVSFPQPGLTAGGVDYTKRAAQIEQAMIRYFASQGISPGPPTDKNFFGKPENSGIPVPVIVDSTASDVPAGWPGNTTSPANGGPPVSVTAIPSNDSVKAGFGFQDAAQLYEASQFYFHPDHLGSTSYVSNTFGEACQHIEYAPFGETFVEEHVGSYTTPYLFDAKGRDDESGYYYFGRRYYEPVTSQWLTIADPMGESYPNEGEAGYGLVTVEDDAHNYKGGIDFNAVIGRMNFSSGGELVAPDDDDTKLQLRIKKELARMEQGKFRNKLNLRASKASNARYAPQLRNLHDANKKLKRQGRNALQASGVKFYKTPPTRARR